MEMLLYTMFIILVVVLANAVFGFVLNLTTPNANFLFFRKLIRAGLVVFFFYVMYDTVSSVPEYDPQSLIAQGADWVPAIVNILAAYFGAWGFICGLEKKIHHAFIFFDSSFYSEKKETRKKIK